MLVHLGKLPNALNLRRVKDSQRVLANEAAAAGLKLLPHSLRSGSSGTALSELICETRNIGGLVGGGGLAAADPPPPSAVSGRCTSTRSPALSRRETSTSSSRPTDAWIMAIIEQGVEGRLYFVGAKVPVASTSRTTLSTGQGAVPFNHLADSDRLSHH